MSKTLMSCLCFFLLFSSSFLFAQRSEIKYLSGLDKDHTVNWAFHVSGGRKGGNWDSIPVPSNWEMQGFGTYRYSSDWMNNPVPDSIGQYRHTFSIAPEWAGKKIYIVFGGVMTDATVLVNGKQAGPTHQGGFYQFRYDITELVKKNEPNVLEVSVKRFSSNRSINHAERKSDFWLFSGIYRPVWLEALPQQNIQRTAINAKADGSFAVDVFLDGIATADRVTAQIKELDGKPLGAPFSVGITKGKSEIRLTTTARNIKAWSAEWPNRYRVDIAVTEKGKTVHQLMEKFGFRTVEVRPNDGLYVNGARVILKGSNRHTIWPTTGRTTSKALSIADVMLMKEMNMNAVRMSHYPPDPHFLDVTDSLGLYVIDELTGWQAAYDSVIAKKLVEEMIVRDVNHPSIIIWSNGNEGGWNTSVDDDFAMWDPQKRTVIHPWANFNGINTGHYEVYDCCTGTFFHGNDLIMPTEFLHGLYDGGHGAGLDDWWKIMQHHPLTAGGFLWAFADEGIVRLDQDGKIDVAGNLAPDGIVGPYREKEGSFYTIKEIWSPVYLPWSEQTYLPVTFNGKMQVENRFDHTSLKEIRFSWQLVDFAKPGTKDTGHTVVLSGRVASPDVPPHQTGQLQLPLPAGWQKHDAFSLTATDVRGRNIYTWTWMIRRPSELAKALVPQNSGKATGSASGERIIAEANGTRIEISAETGQLVEVHKNGKKLSLANGPRLLAGNSKPKEIKHRADGNDYLIEASYEGNLRKINWRMMPGGWVKLDYAYQYRGHDTLKYLGVTFDFPEQDVTGIKWLGKGPYRVWKNRMKGTGFDVWQKKYNDAVTGTEWQYPEFKGFHANMYWAQLQTKEAPVQMIFATDNLFLRLFTPKEPSGKGFDPRFTHVDFPAGDISLLHGIAPIGTKFHPANEHGPAGANQLVPRLGGWYEGTVYFYFGDDFARTNK